MEEHIKRYQQDKDKTTLNPDLQTRLLDPEIKENKENIVQLYPGVITTRVMTEENSKSFFTGANIYLTISTIMIYVFVIYLIVSYR
jgi:hypothetical protein